MEHSPLVALEDITIRATIAPLALSSRKLSVQFDFSDLPGLSLLGCKTETTGIPTESTGEHSFTIDLSDAPSQPAHQGENPIPWQHTSVACTFRSPGVEQLLPHLPANIRVTAAIGDDITSTEALAIDYPEFNVAQAIPHRFVFPGRSALSEAKIAALRRAYAEGLRATTAAVADAQVSIQSQRVNVAADDGDLTVVFLVVPREDVPLNAASLKKASADIATQLKYVGYEGKGEVGTPMPVDGVCGYDCCYSCPGKTACVSDDQCASGECADYQCVKHDVDPEDDGNPSRSYWYAIAALIVVGIVAGAAWMIRKHRQKQFTDLSKPMMLDDVETSV
jgi:hypothetical protein